MIVLKSKTLGRRATLRGLGATLLLPWLEAMSAIGNRASAASPAHLAPKRLVFMYTPNGMIMNKWLPENEGKGYTLSPTLAGLAPFRDDFLVISGLDHANGEALGDGPGDHARACASYLTGAHPKKTAADVSLGVSVDQLAAAELGHLTRLPSLELICDRGQQAGACDSGYSCAYQNTLSWRSPTSPLPPEVDPRLVFERIFGPTGAHDSKAKAAQAARIQERRSVLDFVAKDAKKLSGGVGKADQQKLDEYYTSVRSVELQLQNAAHIPTPRIPKGAHRPTAFPATYEEHLKIMSDLLVLALQTDSTRIATFIFSRELSNRTFPSLECFEGHHDLSHHSNKPHKIAMLEKIDAFHVGQLARIVAKLKATREGDASLLDSLMLVYGSGLSDGNKHQHRNLPTLVFGRGNNTLGPGRHIKMPPGTPMSDLWLSLLGRMGVKVTAFADSKGEISALSA